MVSQHRNGERNGETGKIAYRHWKPSITMEHGTWTSTGMPSTMPLSSFELKLLNNLLTKMNMQLLLVCFIPEKTWDLKNLNIVLPVRLPFPPLVNQYNITCKVVVCWNLLVRSFCGQPFCLNKKSACMIFYKKDSFISSLQLGAGWLNAQLCDKGYQLLAHDQWFSPGIPASSTTKTGRYSWNIV